MSNTQINRMKMEALAAVDEDFKRLYDFFKRLAGLTKEQYLSYCRSQMPGLADVLHKKIGRSSPLLVALRQAPTKSDEEVVALSASLMESIIKTVEKI